MMLTFLPRQLRRLVVVVILVLIGIYGGLYYSTSQREDLNTNLAKLIAQFVVVVLVGAVVADYFKRLEQDRRDRESFATFREDIRQRLTACYHKVKASRSVLRAAGVSTRFCKREEQVTEDLLAKYREQMEAINEVQLDLEKLWHEVKTFSHLFTHSEDLVGRIQVMSGFLRKVLDEYENIWCSMRQSLNSQSSVDLNILSHLVGNSTKG